MGWQIFRTLHLNFEYLSMFQLLIDLIHDKMFRSRNDNSQKNLSLKNQNLINLLAAQVEFFDVIFTTCI